MDEYMENLKSLRSQVNDIEDEASKRSVEEQKQKTAIQALDSDLNLVRSETKRLKDEAMDMLAEKVQIGSEIAEKQGKIAALQLESHTLSQTLELLHQEMASTLIKLKEKRSFYMKITEELNLKMLEQEAWLTAYRQKMIVDEKSVEECQDEQIVDTEGNPIDVPTTTCHDFSEKHKELLNHLKNSQRKIEDLTEKKSVIALEITKTKELVEQINQRIEAVPLALKEMDVDALQEEHGTLTADKTAELTDLQWLKDQISQIREFSEVVKCSCGKEYNVKLSS